MRFDVCIPRMEYNLFTMEAESEDAAIRIARERLESGETGTPLDLDPQLNDDENTWIVEEVC